MRQISYNSRILTPWMIAALLGVEVRLAPGPWPQFYQGQKVVGYIHREKLFNGFRGLLCLKAEVSIPPELQSSTYLL